MTAVTPAAAASTNGPGSDRGSGGHGSSSNGDGLDDLVPAALIGARDGLPVIHANYTKVGEHLRRNAPPEMQCSMFCGGKRCKYEAGPASWKPEDMAIDGIYSHWITGEHTCCHPRKRALYVTLLRIL